MVTVKKFAPGNVNLTLMIQQIAALLPTVPSMLMAGFTRAAEGRYTRNAGTQEIGRSKSGGNVVIDTADPGEIRFTTDIALTPTEDSDLNNVVANHNPLSNTQEQSRQITDETTLATVVANLKSPAWDGLNNPDRITTLRRAVQLLFRNNVFRDFDTDG